MSYNNKNVLVTGAAGISGHSMVKRLLDEGSHVRATVYTKRKLNLPKHKNLEIIKADLNSHNKCLDITKDMDVVFNFVAFIRGAGGQIENQVNLVRNNVVPTINMLDACVKSKVDKVGFIGSSTIYPDSDYPVKEDEGFIGNPHPAYFGVAWMIRYAEIVCNHFNNITNTKFSIIRTTAMYGPNDNFNENGHVIPQLIMKADSGMNPYEIWGDGNQVRDFTYVDDVIDALLLVTEKSNGKVYNVATGIPTTVTQLVETITDIYGYKPEFKYDLSKPTMIQKRVVDVSKIYEELNWKAKHTLRDGLEKTIEWYKTQKK